MSPSSISPQRLCSRNRRSGVATSGRFIAQQSSDGDRNWRRSLRSPLSLSGAYTQSVMFFVDDADAHCALDPEGHIWWITQRLRSAP